MRCGGRGGEPCGRGPAASPPRSDAAGRRKTSTMTAFFHARGCCMRAMTGGSWVVFISASLAALGTAASSGADAPGSANAQSAAPFGFGAAEGARELALEQRFDGALDPSELRGWLKTLSAEPNHVGSPH